MNDLVTIEAGRAVASSRSVAETFGKNHRDVLRSIDGLVSDEPGLLRNFAQQSFGAAAGNGAVRTYRAFTMDRDGFSLLAMGFTGAKALRWKIAYIEAFNAMEAALASPPAPAPAAIVDHETWRVSLQFVREARSLGGRAAGRKAWTIAGLPDVFGDDQSLPHRGYAADPEVADWFDDRVECAAGIRTPSSWLFADYQRWSADRERNAVSMVIFGKSLTALGVRGFNSNGIKREGVRLRQGKAS